MAPKRTKKQSPAPDPDGMFAGMTVFLVDTGVQPRRLQIWKQKLEQMGASIEDRLSKKVTHVFAMNSDSLLKKIGRERLSHFKGSVLLYKWLENSLTIGEKVSEAPFVLALGSGEAAASSKESLEESRNIGANGHDSSDVRTSHHKRIRTSPEDHKTVSSEDTASAVNSDENSGSDDLSATPVPVDSSPTTSDSLTKTAGTSDSSLPYSPPDQNKNITEIFGKLMNIYRALGDDRRSFSYQKAIPVIEKLPFKIEGLDQVKHLPSIGKSMQDHILEIVNTGKLSKLEHFETDEKVRTISLFGEVWGIGPATALKLYEKGHRTLEDLKSDDSLTSSQRLGLKYFDDIRTRIPRHEVQEMEHLLQNAAEEILPGVMVVCGGSYRRGKASCGDLDIVITHPDGRRSRSLAPDLSLRDTQFLVQGIHVLGYSSWKHGGVTFHVGFLRKYVKHLKDMKFLREDLVFSIHSEEGTDAGVDTYFGLCTYPGRELRHRIDLKVYPRDIYAFGLIAWTGNDVLNRRLRLLAESKGYRLDDTGLFLATQSPNSKRGTRTKASLHFKTEKEVFDFLGFPWFEPHERNL